MFVAGFPTLRRVPVLENTPWSLSVQTPLTAGSVPRMLVMKPNDTVFGNWFKSKQYVNFRMPHQRRQCFTILLYERARGCVAVSQGLILCYEIKILKRPIERKEHRRHCVTRSPELTGFRDSDDGDPLDVDAITGGRRSPT